MRMSPRYLHVRPRTGTSIPANGHKAPCRTGAVSPQSKNHCILTSQPQLKAVASTWLLIRTPTFFGGSAPIPSRSGMNSFRLGIPGTRLGLNLTSQGHVNPASPSMNSPKGRTLQFLGPLNQVRLQQLLRLCRRLRHPGGPGAVLQRQNREWHGAPARG